MMKNPSDFERFSGAFVFAVIFLLIIALLFFVIGSAYGLITVNHPELAQPQVSFICNTNGSFISVSNTLQSAISINSIQLFFDGSSYNVSSVRGYLLPAGSVKYFYYPVAECSLDDVFSPVEINMSYSAETVYKGTSSYPFSLPIGLISITQH